jgi:competence protein ComEC
MPTLTTFTDIINRVLPEPHAGLLAGIVFGTKASISTELYDALVTTGTLHIAALSGMNITILTKLFFSTFILGLPRSISSILTIGVIVLFVLFVGPSPTVVRAAIMGSITLIAPLTGRISTAIITWSITIASMLIFDITLVGNVSFQLSALASLGMILFSKNTSASATAEHKGIAWIREELATTLSAQVFTIPLILFTFGRISLISPISNLLIGWTIPIITVLGLCISLLGWVWLPIGQLLAWVSWVLLEWLIQVVLLTSRIPFASIGR